MSLDYLSTALNFTTKHEVNEKTEQRAATGWNSTLKTAWLPMWRCACGATVGGEYGECFTCGRPRPIEEIS